MTTAQVVKTSVTVSNNSPIKDYVHIIDDHTQPTYEMTPGFKSFTITQDVTTFGAKCNINSKCNNF